MNSVANSKTYPLGWYASKSGSGSARRRINRVDPEAAVDDAGPGGATVASSRERGDEKFPRAVAAVGAEGHFKLDEILGVGRQATVAGIGRVVP